MKAEAQSLKRIFQGAMRYVVAAMTGLRQGELIALRWSNIDWTAGAIRVRRSHVRRIDGVPKSRRSVRTVPMADDVARALEAISPADAEDDALVFPDPLDGRELRPNSMLTRMRKALRAAGLEESHCSHDLRHTFGTRMAARGTPMRTLQEWMGHKDILTTQRYADYAPR
jgi:integrase